MPFKVPEPEFPLGSSVREPISGIEGIIDSKYYWFNGLIRSSILSYGHTSDGAPKTSYVFDEHLLQKHDGLSVTKKIDRKEPIFDFGDTVIDQLTPDFYGTIVMIRITLNGCNYYAVQCPFLNSKNEVILNEINEMQLQKVAKNYKKLKDITKPITSEPPNLKTAGSKTEPVKRPR